MGLEQIQNFLTLPELPDIISYAIMIFLFVFECFTKSFVKKDNKATLFSVDKKIAKLNKLEKELEQGKKELSDEREDRKKMKKELEVIKKAIKTSSGNSHELVSNGTANHVAKMLDNTDIAQEGNENE